MSCWHMLMGKGYSLLAGSSGSTPDSCMAASWTSRLSSSDDADADADADAEHEEMVNELQAMVLIGNQWANAPEDPTAENDDHLPSNVDTETATGTWNADEDDNSWIESNVDDVNGGGPAREKIETELKNLYSTVVKSTSIRESSLHAVFVDRAFSTRDRDKLLPLPVYEDATSTSSLCSTEGDNLQAAITDVEILNYTEGPTEVLQFQQQTSPSEDVDNVSAPMRVLQEEDNRVDQEVEGPHEAAVATHLNDRDNSGPQRQPFTLSQQADEQQTDFTPRRSSQLSKTLRNNLERLLQRGPVSAAAATASSRRRRKAKRDDELATSGEQQTMTPSQDRKQQHRRHRHHHRHHHHHHHHRHFQQQQQDRELDDASSLVTDTATLRSVSVSSRSSISDGRLFTTLKLLTYRGDTRSGNCQELSPNRTQQYSVQYGTRNVQTQPTNIKPHSFGHAHLCKFMVQVFLRVLSPPLLWLGHDFWTDWRVEFG